MPHIPDRELIGGVLELLMALCEKLTGKIPVLRLRREDGVEREVHLEPGARVRWADAEELRAEKTAMYRDLNSQKKA